MTIALYSKAQNDVRLPFLSVPFLCLFGVSLAMIVSRHESVEAIARDYICIQVILLVVGLLYNLFVLKKIDQTYQELLEYHKQMDEIHTIRSKRGPRPV